MRPREAQRQAQARRSGRSWATLQACPKARARLKKCANRAHHSRRRASRAQGQSRLPRALWGSASASERSSSRSRLCRWARRRSRVALEDAGDGGRLARTRGDSCAGVDGEPEPGAITEAEEGGAEVGGSR